MVKEKTEPAYRVYRSRKDLFIDNLIGGVAWGLGGIISASILVGIIGLIFSRLETAPLVGSLVQQVMEEVQKYQ